MSEDRKRLNVPIPISLHKEIKVAATMQEKTLTQWVLEAIQEKLQKETKKKK